MNAQTIVRDRFLNPVYIREVRVNDTAILDAHGIRLLGTMRDNRTYDAHGRLLCEGEVEVAIVQSAGLTFRR